VRARCGDLRLRCCSCACTLPPPHISGRSRAGISRHQTPLMADAGSPRSQLHLQSSLSAGCPSCSHAHAFSSAAGVCEGVTGSAARMRGRACSGKEKGCPPQQGRRVLAPERVLGREGCVLPQRPRRGRQLNTLLRLVRARLCGAIAMPLRCGRRERAPQPAQESEGARRHAAAPAACAASPIPARTTRPAEASKYTLRRWLVLPLCEGCLFGSKVRVRGGLYSGERCLGRSGAQRRHGQRTAAAAGSRGRWLRRRWCLRRAKAPPAFSFA
jgi:hypothetical protein